MAALKRISEAYLYHSEVGGSLGVPEQEPTSHIGDHIHCDEDGAGEAGLVAAPSPAEKAVHSKPIAI